MTNKIPQTKTELEAHLAEHLYFLEMSAKAFDDGYEGEAKRLATSLRVLLHDTRMSKSLLGQLEKKNIQFHDTALEFSPSNLLTHSGLTFMRASLAGARYMPLLDETPSGRIKKLDFDKWWNAIVIVDDQRNKMSRKDIVLYVANQDGGSHVDPTLDEIYARLSRQNSLNWFYINESGSQPLGGPQLAGVRQITHEVLKTLKYEIKEKKHRLRHRKKT